MNRRDLFKGTAGLAAGLILPPTLDENVEAVRRWWACGAIPGDTPLGKPITYPVDYEDIYQVLAGLFGQPTITTVPGDGLSYEWTWDARREVEQAQLERLRNYGKSPGAQ